MSMVPWYDLERPFRLMEKEFFQPENFFGPLSQMVPRDFISPDFYSLWNDERRRWEKMIKPIEQLSSTMNQLSLKDVGSNFIADDEKFQVNVDVQHFAPEEIKVKVTDGHVCIEGNHEEKRDEHGYVSRRFIRRYALPQGCLADTVESKLSSDGVLTVTAPRVLALPSPGERIVPIKYSGPVKKHIGFTESNTH